MSLHKRVIRGFPNELARHLIESAEEKYLAGLELMISGHPAVGIYLMGYTAEMMIKYAYFHFVEPVRNDSVKSLLKPAAYWLKTYVQGHFPSNTTNPTIQNNPTIQKKLLERKVQHDHFHNLGFWARLLYQRRRDEKRPFAKAYERKFLKCVARLRRNWWVEMRYRSIRVTPDEANAVYNDVTWLVDHQDFLWR